MLKMELSWRNPPGWAGAALRGLRTSLRAAASPRGSLSPGRAEPAPAPGDRPGLTLVTPGPAQDGEQRWFGSVQAFPAPPCPHMVGPPLAPTPSETSYRKPEPNQSKLRFQGEKEDAFLHYSQLSIQFRLGIAQGRNLAFFCPCMRSANSENRYHKWKALYNSFYYCHIYSYICEYIFLYIVIYLLYVII